MTDPGITWTTPLAMTPSDVEAFIAAHDGHDIRVAMIHPSGERSTFAQHVRYSMYCPECGMQESREHESNPCKTACLEE